ASCPRNAYGLSLSVTGPAHAEREALVRAPPLKATLARSAVRAQRVRRRRRSRLLEVPGFAAPSTPNLGWGEALSCRCWCRGGWPAWSRRGCSQALPGEVHALGLPRNRFMVCALQHMRWARAASIPGVAGMPVLGGGTAASRVGGGEWSAGVGRRAG